MTVVVDVGCAPQRREGSDEVDESVVRLVERFRPSALYGFDPWPGAATGEVELSGCRCVLDGRAAWVRDGEVQLSTRDGLGIVASVAPHLPLGPEYATVPCFDFPAWLARLLSAGEPVVVKLDCEGAEFELLERVVEDGLDARLDRLLVEWHTDVPWPIDLAARLRGWRAALERRLRCPVEPW